MVWSYHRERLLPKGYTAQWTGSVTNPLKEFKMRKTTLQFVARNARFSNNDHLSTDDHFILSHIRRARAMGDI